MLNVHPNTPDQVVAVVLLDIAVIVLAARGMGILARRVGQPWGRSLRVSLSGQACSDSSPAIPLWASSP
jgi:hypothetical protein